MKKRWIKITGIVLASLLLIMAVLPFLFKGRILQKVQDEANASLNAKLHFDDVSLNLFRSFPNFSLGLENLSIEGKGDFQGDTLIKAKEIRLSLDLRSVIGGGTLKIGKIHLEQPDIRLKVLKDGKANWDITKPSVPETPAQPEAPSTFRVALKSYSIHKGRLVYDDQSMDFKASLEGLEHEGSGDFTADQTRLDTETQIDSLSISYDGIPYLRKALLKYKAGFQLDLKNSIYAFEENELFINDLGLKFEGKVMMPSEEIGMDIRWEVLKNEVKSFISLIPGAYTADFNDVQSSGKLALKGYVKGVYSEKSMPGFGLTVQIENGKIQYPSLPKAIQNMQLHCVVDCPSGKPDATVTDLKKLHLEMGAFPVDMTALVRTPVSDPDIKMQLKTHIDLSALKEYVPLEKGSSMQGMLDADVHFAGRLSAIEKEQYTQFDAGGVARLGGFKYTDAALPDPVLIEEARLEVAPQQMALQAFRMKTGKSDIEAQGTISNYLAWMFRDELLKGQMQVNAKLLDLNPFMTETTATTAEASPQSTGTDVQGYIRVPSNLDLNLLANIQKLRYDNMELNAVQGSLTVKDAMVRLDRLSMQTLGGSIQMGGLYDTRDAKGPAVDFLLDMNELDVKACAKTFNTVKTLAPVAEHAQGKVSVKDFRFACKSDAAFNPIMNTINGAGKLVTSVIAIEGFPMIQKTAEALKIDKLKKWQLDKVNAGFTIVNGQVSVAPFETKVGAYKSTLGGTSGLDQSIDYALNIEIPRAEFGGQANAVLNGMVGRAQQAGFKGSLGEVIPVAVKITGTFKDPKVKTDIRSQATDAMDDLKKQAEDRAREELEKRKKELEDRANAEKERLKNEAEEKLRKEQDRLKSEADKAKAEAERKAKEEADKAKKKAEEEAKKKLNNLLKGK